MSNGITSLSDWIGMLSYKDKNCVKTLQEGLNEFHSTISGLLRKEYSIDFFAP